MFHNFHFCSSNNHKRLWFIDIWYAFEIWNKFSVCIEIPINVTECKTKYEPTVVANTKQDFENILIK